MSWVHNLKDEQILDYFDERWTHDQTASIEEHFAVCAGCADRASNLFVAAKTFDALCDSVAAKHRLGSPS